MERILIGHFLTRADAARSAKLSSSEVQHRPDLLRLAGIWLEETYFEFQFDGDGIRRDLGTVVVSLKGRFSDLAIADWIARPNTILGERSPLGWLGSGRAYEAVLDASLKAGPVDETERPSASAPGSF